MSNKKDYTCLRGMHPTDSVGIEFIYFFVCHVLLASVHIAGDPVNAALMKNVLKGREKHCGALKAVLLSAAWSCVVQVRLSEMCTHALECFHCVAIDGGRDVNKVFLCLLKSVTICNGSRCTMVTEGSDRQTWGQISTLLLFSMKIGTCAHTQTHTQLHTPLSR